jgi:glycosyltransferase involved in cell wall biosynthesis
MAIYKLPRMKHPEQKGLISIIVPIYNNEACLRGCLDSISAQTFTNWEAILVDDGSTDGTGKIVDEYAEKDSRFIAIHKRNEGTLLARKTGLENSRGEFIANIDHDDIYNPKFLEKMYTKIMEMNVDFVWCKCQIADDRTDERYISYFVTDYKWSTDASENIAAILTLGQGMSLVTWDKLIKRDIYAKINFPDGHFVLGEDPIQMVQVAYHSKSAAFVAENLYFHKLDGSSTITKPLSWIRFLITMNEVLENLFNGVIPENVKISFYNFTSWHNTSVSFFLLDKKQRLEFKNQLEPFIFECIKRKKRLVTKICLHLANKGIMFPFVLGRVVTRFIRSIVRRS